MKRFFPLAVLIFVFSGTAYAFDISGLQPTAPNGIFSTFSAESLPMHELSIEPWAERSREPDFYRFGLRGAYGISDSVELLVTLPYVLDFKKSIDGLEDISVGVKHRFYDEGKYGPSLAYMVNASIDFGRKELSTDGRYGAGLIISKRVGPFSGHLNFFYEKPGSGRLEDEVSFSGGIDLSAAHNFNLLGEVIFKNTHFSSKFNFTEARFGYRLKTTDNTYTTLGVGLDFKDRSPEYRVILSFCFTTSREKKEIKKIYEEE
jgi:hypothetical protein